MIDIFIGFSIEVIFYVYSGSSIANSTLSSESGPSGSDLTPRYQKTLDSSTIVDMNILDTILPNISGSSFNSDFEL